MTDLKLKAKERKSGHEELIPTMKLSKRQREILQLLADGEELVYEKGGGWWIGDIRTNGIIFKTLIRYMCLKQESTDNLVEHWHINETGMKSLKEGYLFIHPKLI